MRGKTLALWATVAVAFLALAPAASAKHIEGGILDDVETKADSIPGDAPVVFMSFSTDNADLGTGEQGGKEKRVQTAQQMKEECPVLLSSHFVAELKKLGPYSEVTRGEDGKAPKGAIVVDGEVTLLDPGSRAKRYFVGFGAGKSKVEVKGVIKGPDGKELASFRHRRIGAMGIGGGKSEKKMTDDCGSIGEDLAEFLSAWAKGQPLKK
jgi:Domain of unknown function (DUF4410)